MTTKQRIENKLSVDDIRKMGFIFRLIDSYNSITIVIGHAKTRKELNEYIELEKLNKGLKCDLITQEWNPTTNMYDKNFYITNPRDFIINGKLVKGVQKNYVD